MRGRAEVSHRPQPETLQARTRAPGAQRSGHAGCGVAAVCAIVGARRHSCQERAVLRRGRPPTRGGDERWAARCERLICKYKRKDSRASAEAQQKARARCEQRGKLMHFDWKKGFGFITPDNRQPGSDTRRQGIFFHIRDWKCSSTFPDKQAQLPLPVRFNRQPSNRAQGGRWRAVQVSRLGGAKAHLLHGSPA